MNTYIDQMFGLKGKVALITGATHGIGFGIACALAKAGATICFNGRYKENNEQALQAYAEEGIQAHGYVCDVTNESEVADMMKKIEAEVGTIDILVNNAGIIQRKPMLEMDVTDFRKVVDVDLTGPFIMAKAVLLAMIEKNAGKIINICSLMSELGRETVVGYAAAKGGLKMLTRNICAEFGEYNIQCNGIGPGYIATSQTAPLREKQADGSPNPFDAFILAKTPAHRWGKPEDLEGPAVFLASSASDFVNGQILFVDGGILASLGRAPQ
ncbi:gluconate 5-dehydrogenase [Dubosiella newyorkensis]|uniref:gluconate 5-dehydrogenase n=1 Tax=Dubosiella newyorkensis TaxID=1862672 RepID=UPI0027300725|nr:gluconate 5-dehydrogenase [Dubosiella newyorkensis]